MHNQFEQKYHFEQKCQQSIWTKILKLNKKTNINNQFEQKNHQSVLNRNDSNPIEQKYQHSNLNKNVNNQFEQEYQQSIWMDL